MAIEVFAVSGLVTQNRSRDRELYGQRIVS